MGGMAKRSAAMFWLKTDMPAPVFDGLGHATPQSLLCRESFLGTREDRKGILGPATGHQTRR